MAVGLLLLILLIGTVAVFLFLRTRKLLREAKNFERGLKMVPLLIHLPPTSDDVNSENRDSRDVVDENISKAQTLYSIIASTAKKGFKSKFYGQRHISLEIVSYKGGVYFYAAVPVVLVSVVEQAILGAYPTSRIEEVEEHNIFNPVGKISATCGGELVLKESYIYPIATYQDLKRDTLQALLNALANLKNDEGVGVQILLRPASDGWQKVAADKANKKREGKTKKEGIEYVFWGIGQLFTALTKPPDAKDPNDTNQEKPGTHRDQTIADSIEEKINYVGYEVSIRIIVSSDSQERSKAIQNNVVASFSLFDAPGKNGFKFVQARDVEEFVTAYILRFFPPENNKNILNVVELATLFHFPDSTNMPTSQVERLASKQVDGPRVDMNEGLLIGHNVFRGVKKPIRLSDETRRRHVYIVGQTGTGKSVFLENLMVQDMLNGKGFAFVDPHGDSAETLLGLVPKERTEDVIYFCPSDMEYPMGFNLFEYQFEDQKDFLIQETIGMLKKLYDPNNQGIMGPRYEHIFRNAALTIMADPAGGTFIDIPKLFRDNQYVNQKLKYVKDNLVREFWQKEIPQSQRSSEFGEVTSWFVSKFGAFLSNAMMRNIIGQTKSSINLREIMDSGKILLVNLNKGMTGELNSKLLGMIFVMQFQAAAMSRANVPKDQRRDFCLYVDEFQNFSTESFATILSESRKFGLSLTVANQFVSQLTEEVRDAVFGNVGTIIAHRVGVADAEVLVKNFDPIFDVDDLEQLPIANTIVKTLVAGVPTQPFNMVNLPMLTESNKQLADALKQLSAAKYGRPRAEVEKEIFARLETQSTPNPMEEKMNLSSSFNDSSFGTAKPASGSKSSFLDEWLAKRKQMQSPVSENKNGSDGRDSTQLTQETKTENTADTSVKHEEPSMLIENQNASKVANASDEVLVSVDEPIVKAPVTDQQSPNVRYHRELKHNDTIVIDRDGNLSSSGK